LLVKNTGNRAGWAVPELYVRIPPPRPGEVQPPRQLKGYDKVQLAPGKTRRVTIPLNDRSFAHWDTDANSWAVSRACYGIDVGASSRNLILHGRLPRAGGVCGAK
jgi:beta-glucosidase